MIMEFGLGEHILPERRLEVDILFRRISLGVIILKIPLLSVVKYSIRKPKKEELSGTHTLCNWDLKQVPPTNNDVDVNT